MRPGVNSQRFDYSNTTQTFTPLFDDPLDPNLITGYDDETVVSSVNLLRRYTSVSCPPVVMGDRKSPTPWSYTVFKYEDDLERTYETRFFTNGRVQSYSNLISGSSPQMAIDAPSVDQNSLYNELLEKVYSQIRGDLDLSISAFQAKQTGAMFNASQQLDDYVRGSWSKRRLIKAAGSAWLQWVYGIKPLLSDIHSIAEESLRWHANRVKRLKVRKSDKDTVTQSGTINNRTETVDSSLEIKMQIIGSYVVEDNFSPSRLTSLNPASIAWELLPYSFVVDWIYDVGSYLRSAESAVLFSNSWTGGAISVLKIEKRSWRYSSNLSIQNDINRSIQGSGRMSTVTFSRELLNSPPFPRPPTLNAKLGSSRLLSSAALLSTFLRGK